jgi:hypothetical protein
MTQWKNCSVSDCKDKVCVWLSEEFCFPHGMEAIAQGRAKSPLSVQQMAQEVLDQWNRAEEGLWQRIIELLDTGMKPGNIEEIVQEALREWTVAWKEEG